MSRSLLAWIMDERYALVAVRNGWKPGGVALKSTAEVAKGVIQVSVRAKRRYCEYQRDQRLQNI